MGYSVLPSNLDNAVQKGMLAKRFEMALKAELGYRDAAERVVFPGRYGTTITRTRPGRLGIVNTPVNPATNVPLTNGLTASTYQVEQYTTTTQLWAGSAEALNLIDDETAIASIFLQNAENLGEQAFRSLDGLVLSTLQNAYLGGNTIVSVTNGGPSLGVSVNDVRGFQFVIVNGVQVPVSATNPMPVTFNNGGVFTTYSLVTTSPSVVNVSTAASVGGISGLLTFSSNVAVVDATAGNPIVSAFAPFIVRPNGRASTEQLTSGDIFTLATIRAGVTVLNNNNVPKLRGGYYNCYIDPTSKAQLFSDTEFQLLYRGTQLTGSPEYRNLTLIDGLGVRFIETNQAPQQELGSIAIHRPLICGAGAVIEDYFKSGMDAIIMKEQGAHPSLFNITKSDEIRMITRGQIDQLAQYISQAWSYVAGWVAPTDSTVTPATIKTASNAYYKRAVFIETV